MEKQDIANGVPSNRCVNCGHDVMVYHHPLGSSLIFHDDNGVFSRMCTCGCKNPKKRDNEK